MLPGVSQARKKDGTLYYRSGITYRNKHISLGSYASETAAHDAYRCACRILSDTSVTLTQILTGNLVLSFEKAVILINFRDNHLYFKTPIYLYTNYFSYYLSAAEEYKFDIDDLFYYSSHKIMKRGGHLFISEYGMQTSLLSRYGIRSFAVEDRDYTFANGDRYDFRYSNIVIINRYFGVTKSVQGSRICYETRIHINGNYLVGTYPDETTAAIAYNKAADLAISHGFCKNFAENYILDLSPRDYASIYASLKLSRRYLAYLKNSGPDRS